jgi:D-serine deaminase-like pyridoxal phosphate-dependent protein
MIEGHPVMTLNTIPTPRICIDRTKVHANIASMQAVAQRAGVSLRPHAKTHKSPIIARWQLDAGAAGICCAKLGEAEVFAEAGIENIRLPYPINPANADRLMALQDRVRLSIVIDHVAVADEWSARMTAAYRTLDVLVKVDVGAHRCGVDPDQPGTIDAVRHMATRPGLRFLGLLSHAGQAYAALSEAALAEVADHEIATLMTLAGSLRASGIGVAEISVGATPTARFIDRQQGVTEMRPGTYVFCDRTQVGLGAATLADCAMSIVSTVVSRPSPTRVVFDAGSKTLSQDAARGFESPRGHGLVYPSLDAGVPDESIVVEKLSEEHAVASVQPDSPLQPGDRVRIIPNHTCVVTNLAEELLITEGAAIVDQMRVEARGKIW